MLPSDRAAEPHASERERAFFVRLARLGLEVAHATIGSILLLALALGAAFLYRLPAMAKETAALVLAIPLAWQLSSALVRGLFRPGDPRYRLVPCDERTARHLHRWLLVIGRLFAVFAPLGFALEINHYPRGALDVLWLAYEGLTLVALVLLFSRRGLVRGLGAAPETRIGQAMASLAAAIYPFFAVYVIGLLALHADGYVNLARFLGRSTSLSGAVLVLAAIVWKYATYRLDFWNERRLAAAAARAPPEEIDPEKQRQRGFYVTGRALAHFAIFGATALALLFAWGLDARQVRSVVADKHLVGWEMDGRAIGVTLLDLFECAFFFILSFLGGGVARTLFLERLKKNSTLDRGMQHALANAGFALVITVGGYLILSTLRVNFEAAKWLGGAVGIGIGFGLQNIVNNFVSGIILLAEKPIRTDDVVEVSGVVGRVDRIGTRSTVVIDGDNIARIIPNADFVSAHVTNWSYGDPKTRLHCPVGVAYGTDPSLVRTALLEVAAQHERILKKPEPDVSFKQFADSSLDFELTFFVAEPRGIAKVKSDINFAIEAAFKRHGIEIPFPQRDLRIIQKEPIVTRVVRDGLANE